ncbi:type IV secretory system conjugative DNA transfer family protein [Butyrivibrio sp. WCD3002]|uniref:type IV secretory system conjugative DNA transfer family protein n=1 Tax=Butyrivibrio sp. WCD3002 TaxID=1280676 RepID=UPI0004293976|nr:type IV secretory system conjugative DNA transfer family protein [Butyrivibrio sp. WCD3002]
MVTEKRFSIFTDIILYYHILFFVLYGAVLFQIRYVPYILLTKQMGTADMMVTFIPIISTIRKAIRYLTQLLILFSWLIPFFLTLKAKYYMQSTGRTFMEYIQDMRSSKPYFHLISYFKKNLEGRIKKTDLPQIPWRKSSGFVYGKIDDKYLLTFDPFKDRNGIVSAIWGAPSTGKSAGVIIPSSRTWGMKHGKQLGSTCLLDLKGEIYDANKGFRKIKRFSTIHPEESYKFDPLINARSMDDDERAEFLNGLSSILIPYGSSGSENEYFVNTARTCFIAIFLYCLHKDPDISFPDICKKIALGSYKKWGAIIESDNYEPSLIYINSLKDENEKNAGSGYSKLVEPLRIYTTRTLSYLLGNDGEMITPSDLEHCTDIYIQIDPKKLREEHGPVASMLFECLIRATMNRKEHANPPIAFILDEFGQLPVIPILLQAAALLRSYNVSILLSCQSLAMIDQHYGTNDRKALMDCIKIHGFLSVSDVETRRWVTEKIGKKRVLNFSRTSSTNSNDTSNHGITACEGEEDVIAPRDLEQLPYKDQILIDYAGKYVLAEKTYYFK